MEDVRTIIEKFQNQEIAFDLFSGDVMVNATELAKPFSKIVADFTRLDGTKKFIEVLLEDQEFIENVQFKHSRSAMFKKDLTKEELEEFVIKTKRGQYHSGTFMCEELAIYFAQWLSPQVAVWVSKTIKKMIFGNNSILIRETLIELPALFAQNEIDKALRKTLKEKLIGEKMPEEIKELREKLDGLHREIEKSTHYSQSPTMFDDVTQLGRVIKDLAMKRDEVEKSLAKLLLEQDTALETEDYIEIDSKVKANIKRINQLTFILKRNQYAYSDN